MITTDKFETKAITEIVSESIPLMTREIFKILGMKYSSKDKKQYQAFNCNLFSIIYHTIYTDLDRFKEEF